MVDQFRANNVEQTLLHGNPSNPTKTQRFYVFKRLWNSVRPGYVVKHLTTNDPDLKANDNINIDMVAFDGANSMVVLFNNHTSTNKNMIVKGLAGQDHQNTNDRQTSIANKTQSQWFSNGCAASKVWCSSSRMPVVR